MGRFALALCLCLFIWGCQGAGPPDELVNRLAGARQSAELFTLPHGVNEFDLAWASGRYHLFYDDKAKTRHRSAPTLAGLADAPDDLTIDGQYPSVLEYRGFWYLWVYDPDLLQTRLYRSTKPQGPYRLAPRWAGPIHYSDWRVSRNPADGMFLAVYKHAEKLTVGLMTSDSPNGPWVDRGPVFTDGNRAKWHSKEEADPEMIFWGRRAYLAFAGWDGREQRVGMAPFDTKAMKVTGPSKVLVEPRLPWQRRNGQSKVFSPTWLHAPGPGPGRLFFSHNASARGVASGWAFLQPGGK